MCTRAGKILRTKLRPSMEKEIEGIQSGANVFWLGACPATRCVRENRVCFQVVGAPATWRKQLGGHDL